MPTSTTRVAYRFLQAEDGALGPIPRRKVVDLVNHLMRQADIEGLHRDSSWQPIHRIWKILADNGIPLTLTKAEYQKENGVPVSKTWTFEIPFVNERGRPMVVYGRVVASGAGSVKDPLEVYDVVAYAS